jgi:hypothetical protein
MKKDLIIPALLGLGVYSQANDVSICNNVTMLLTLFVLLEDHQQIEEIKCRQAHDGFYSRPLGNCGCAQPYGYASAAYAPAAFVPFAPYYGSPCEGHCHNHGCGHGCGC